MFGSSKWPRIDIPQEIQPKNTVQVDSKTNEPNCLTNVKTHPDCTTTKLMKPEVKPLVNLAWDSKSKDYMHILMQTIEKYSYIIGLDWQTVGEPYFPTVRPSTQTSRSQIRKTSIFLIMMPLNGIQKIL